MHKVFDRSTRSNENIAESLLFPSIVLFSLIALIYFQAESQIKVTGPGSIGAACLLLGIIISLLVFPPAYLYGLKLRKQGLKTAQKIFNLATLGLATAIMVAMLTAASVALLNEAFKGLSLDKYTSSVLVGTYCGVLIYLIVPPAIKLDSKKIVRMFSTVMIAGVFLSMVTAANPLWWQENFSSLGSTDTASSVAFNFTLILSGLILITLSFHIIEDLHRFLTSNKPKQSTARRLNLLKLLFVFIGICMAGVGFFPYSEAPIMHNLSAYSMVLGFAVMIVALKKILPFIDAAFLANSYFIVGLVALSYVLFTRVGYLNLTAFEMIAFGLTFAWLLMFTRKISSLNPEPLQ